MFTTRISKKLRNARLSKQLGKPDTSSSPHRVRENIEPDMSKLGDVSELIAAYMRR